MNKKIISILIAFLFSLVLWGSVTLSRQYRMIIKVPVQFTGLPEGYSVGYHSVDNASFRIEGQGWMLMAMSFGKTNNYNVSVRQDSGLIFLNLVDALNENNWLSSGLQVFNIYPDTLSVKVERNIQKVLPVTPSIKLDYAENYGLAAPVKLTPDSVIVSGPPSLLKKLKSIPTVEKEYTSLQDRIVERLELKRIEGLSYMSNASYIRIDVQKIADKTFENLPVEVRGVPDSQELLLLPSKISIVIRGGVIQLGRLKAEDFHPYIDYNSIIDDTLGITEPVVDLPPYTRLIRIEPPTLKYIIKKF